MYYSFLRSLFVKAVDAYNRYADSLITSGLLPKYNGDFLAQGYIYGKIFMKIRSAFSQKYEPNCGKNASSRNAEESFKNPRLRIRRRMTSKS